LERRRGWSKGRVDGDREIGESRRGEVGGGKGQGGRGGKRKREELERRELDSGGGGMEREERLREE